MAWEDEETLAAPAAWLLGGAGPGEMPQSSGFSYGVAWRQLGPPGRLGSGSPGACTLANREVS